MYSSIQISYHIANDDKSEANRMLWVNDNEKRGWIACLWVALTSLIGLPFLGLLYFGPWLMISGLLASVLGFSIVTGVVVALGYSWYLAIPVATYVISVIISLLLAIVGAGSHNVKLIEKSKTLF